MIAQQTVLVQLVRLIDAIPAPPPCGRPRRGRPTVYPDALFLKALVVMIVRRLHTQGGRALGGASGAHRRDICGPP